MVVAGVAASPDGRSCRGLGLAKRMLMRNLIFLGLLLAICNLMSLSLRLVKGGAVAAVPSLLGFFAQAPMLLVCAAVLLMADGVSRISPRLVTMPLRVILETVLFILGAGYYFASETFYGDIGVFLPLEVFMVTLTDTVQLFSNVVAAKPRQLLAVVLVAVVLALSRQRVGGVLLRLVERSRHMRKGLVVLALAGLIVSLGIPFFPSWAVTTQVLRQSYPSTFAFWSAVGGGDSEAQATQEDLDDLELIRIGEGEPDWSALGEAMQSRPHIFLVLLESIPHDHVGFMGYHRRDVTPNIDALAAESLVFTNVYAASNHSNYAQTSIYSSQYPLRREKLDYFQTITYPKTLIFDVLSDVGYETALVSTQNENWQGMKRFLLKDSRIDFFYHSEDYGLAIFEAVSEENKIDASIARMVAQDHIASRRGMAPLFVVQNYQTTHFPYRIPEEAHRPYVPDDIPPGVNFFFYPKKLIPNVINRFDNALHYVDNEFGQFLSFLKNNSLYEESIIIVAPDHGEAFCEHGFSSHGTTFFDEQIRTFMLVRTPAARLTGRRNDAVSLIDIPPLILELLGLPNHPNFQGRQILEPSGEARNIFATARGMIPLDGVFQYPWKFIRRGKDAGILFNTKIDPGERVDLVKHYPDKAEELSRTLSLYRRAQLTYYSRLSKEYYPPRY